MSLLAVVLIVLASLSLAAWLYLLVAHGGFWRADQYLPDHVLPEEGLPENDTTSRDWPAVAAIIPARDEADVIGRAVTSLLQQDYPGPLTVWVVDDRSSDGTARIARQAAGDDPRLTIITAPPLPDGWAGKMNAVQAGVAQAPPDSPYLLLTDADIAHGPDALAKLVALAERRKLVLASLMVRLDCRGLMEHLLIPAFVFFFQKLYPFRRVNNPANRLAAAAGGCMLVRASVLRDSGGIAAIHGALIDDCALARLLKKSGPIWLGLSRSSRSLRPYDGLGGVWQMVARTAFTQLHHSLWLLSGTVLGMALLYLAPVVLGIAGLALGQPALYGPALAAWGVMSLLYLPTWRLYGRIVAGVLTLPLAGLLYTAMTVDSARRHWQGKGGAWKGRHYD